MSDGFKRIVVHDFSGHPFQVQLARELGRRGYDSTHLYCPSFQTPRGRVGEEDASEDAPNFASIPIPLFRPFAKYSGGRRLLQEIEYGVRAARAIAKQKPDVVLTANTPLIAAVLLQVLLLRRRLPIVFWQQDVYSVAMAGHLERKGGQLGRLAGLALIRFEKWLLRSSDRVVVISEDFIETLEEWGTDLACVSVIENWAPLDELPNGSRPNAWADRNGVKDELVFLYAGSLGLKHEPSILLDLARTFNGRDDVRIIVASEGRGANWLEREMDEEDKLDLLPFQDYEDLPDMLATADVLLVLLEPDAGGFSVPSKVLTYHCAGRPILGAMPEENLAARNIVRNGSGVVVGPGDSQRFASEAKRLADDPELRESMGLAARSYAETTFDIENIGRRFDAILRAAAGHETLVESSSSR
jgi:glycosyltransferase involved in cell wall biosynthesis